MADVDTVVIGRGGETESAALQAALSGLSDESFSRLRVCYEVPERPRGPHVSATQLIEVVTGTTQQNASVAWIKMKNEPDFNTNGIIHVIPFRFPGQRGGRPSEVVDIPTALQIMMLPGRTAAKVRVKASVLLTRFLAGDLTLVGEVYGMAALQDYLQEHNPTHPLCAFRQAVNSGQTKGEEDAASCSTIELVVMKNAEVKKAKKALPEPVLCWIEDLGAKRDEVPAAKANFRALLEIEIAAGALPKATTATAKNSIAPPVHLRCLAEAALASIREAVQKRLSTLTMMAVSSSSSCAASCTASCTASYTASYTARQGKKRQRQHYQEEHDVTSEEDSDEDILTVSEVMNNAKVWGPVWKPYMSDLSNRMLQVKCRDTDGSFSERRQSHPFGLVHKYKKPDDWPVAHQALQDTKSLYENC